MSRGITERQRQVLRFIQDFIAKEGFPPTLREIGNNFGMKSTNGVNDHLVALEKKGFIRRRSDISRGIELLHPEHEGVPINPTHNVPVLSKVQPNTQLTAMKNVDKYVSLDMSIWSARPDFAVLAKGNSLESAGIREGDLVLVRQDAEAKSGEPIAVHYGDQVTLALHGPGVEGFVLGRAVGFVRTF